jgi:RNA polymerase sigma factor (sigma-70 family)
MLHVNHTSIDPAALSERLLGLWEQTGSPSLEALAHGRPPHEGASVATDQLFVDWVSTSLMDAFKDTGDAAVFALLHELNRASFLHAIQAQLRRSFHRIDPQDVLQEVFLNIYRYPSQFQADRPDAFRGWGHRIVRNTVFKCLKGQARHAAQTRIDDEPFHPEDQRLPRPDRAASEAESAQAVNGAFMLYLHLYLAHFERLSERERRALTMVEVERRSYREAAEALAIRLENLKMVVFRGRRKIFRGMEQSLSDLRMRGLDGELPRDPNGPSGGRLGDPLRAPGRALTPAGRGRPASRPASLAEIEV